jgi:hypothetical protein
MCTSKTCGNWLLCWLTKSLGETSTESNTIFSFKATVSKARHPFIAHPNIHLELSTEHFKTNFGAPNVPVAAGSWQLVCLVETPSPAIT